MKFLDFILLHRFMIFLLIFGLVIVQINLFLLIFYTYWLFVLLEVLCIIFGTWGWIVVLEIFYNFWNCSRYIWLSVCVRNCV
jgi:hypothetical protein